MLLEDHEKARFIEWLKSDAESNRLLYQQMVGMPHLAPIAQRKKQLVAAELLLIQELESSESFTIGPAQQG